MMQGVQKARELVSQPGFEELRGAEAKPGYHARSNDEIKNAIRQMTETDYHPCGTCKMGTDDESVVDSQFRVIGLEGLRVVDASVFPTIISANLNAPVQMMAARAADYILGHSQLPVQHASFSFQ